MAKRRGKKKADWIHRMRTESTTRLPEGSLSEGQTAEDMAQAIKRSSPDFQAAMALLTSHINTMGKRLSSSHRRELEKAKHVLRVIYRRFDRIEDYEKPMQKEKRKKRNRTSSDHARLAIPHDAWVDSTGKTHALDMNTELWEKTDEELSEIALGHPDHDKREAARTFMELRNRFTQLKHDPSAVKKTLLHSWFQRGVIPAYDKETGHWILFDSRREQPVTGPSKRPVRLAVALESLTYVEEPRT